MSRHLLYSQPVQIDFADGSAGAVLVDGKDAFRAWPLESCTENTIMNINGLSVSVQSKYLIRPLQRYLPDEYLRGASSISHCMPDNYADYDDAVGGVTNSPFGNFQTGARDHLTGRGALPYTITGNTAGTATVNATLQTYLKITPLTYGNHSSYGLAGLETADITMSFSNLERMWSRAENTGNRALSSMTVTLGQPTLSAVFSNAGGYTPIPKSVTYPYTNAVVRSNTTGRSLASGATSDFTSNSLQFNTVPSSIYVYLSRAQSEIMATLDSKVSSSDTQCAINSINVTFDNVTGILASATQVQLYDICRRNGLTDSYTGFSGRTHVLGGASNPVGTAGSMLRLDFGTDIPLKEDVLVSSTGVFNFSITVNATNYSGSQIDNVELNILEIQSGAMVVASGSASSFIGVVGQGDASSLKELPVDNLEQPLSYGGDVLSKFGELAAQEMKRKFCGGAVMAAGVVGGQHKSLRLR
jgi:hypothetical protein